MEQKTSFSDLLVEGMKKAALELDELRVQMTLGQYEARDLYERVKKDFSSHLHMAKTNLGKVKESEEALKVINGIEHLQVQLALGIAETEETFAEQKKKLSHALSKLESTLKADPQFRTASAELYFQVEKFKMKLELLSLQFKLKKLKAEYNWDEKKAAYLRDLDQLKEKLKQKESAAKERFAHFQDEITEAFTHIKKAFYL